ncbi:DUF6338 family protein [Aeromicrobium sp. CnD17-E]|uniref:DUF6338 family protein n=1 Tax=Aeromicrobium sp. CnD17-E TaxID=2954487 RepID=UPI0020981FC3|nr:DUF6338 family protein [Aeromicrobium sp. CnD17-E]MCO7238980.1 DUF6338 family protein [Aeromicrobium sp. CnD17-E]
MAPTSVTGLLIFLLFVVPGFVYQATRISVRGRLPLDLELSTRIVRAIVTSGIFGLVYLVALGDTLVHAARGEGLVVEHPRVGALLALAGGIAIPSVLALLPAPTWGWLDMLRSKLPDVTRYDFTPTAWDKAFQSAEECFIRVLTNDDRWIAGYYGSSSYATSYPEPQQLFLEKAYQVSADGTIGDEIEGTRGVIVDCAAIQLLQILAVTEAEGGL